MRRILLTKFSKGQFKILKSILVDSAKAAFIAAFSIQVLFKTEFYVNIIRYLVFGLVFTILALYLQKIIKEAP